MDAEKLISWGSRATIIKRYGLEERTLWSAWVGVCALLALLQCLCVGCLLCRWGVHALMSCCFCVHQKVGPRLIIECVRASLCVVSPFSCSLSLYVLVWCGAATVISGLLRRSSGPAPDQFSCGCQVSVWQIAWRGTAELSSTQLGPTQMVKALCHNNNFDFAGFFSLTDFSFAVLSLFLYFSLPLCS